MVKLQATYVLCIQYKIHDLDKLFTNKHFKSINLDDLTANGDGPYLQEFASFLPMIEYRGWHCLG